jgi:hypothetical protein
MFFDNPYFTPYEKICLLERWILVHSYIYYTLDDNLVSDNVYDKNTRQLAKLLKMFPKSANAATYSKAFSGYDGGSGFNLLNNLTEEELRWIKVHATFALSAKTKGI